MEKLMLWLYGAGSYRDGAQAGGLCESDVQFRYRVKAAVQRGTADYYSRLAAPEGNWASRGFLGGSWGGSGASTSIQTAGGAASGAARGWKGTRRDNTRSDASFSSGALV
jgi:hypothetical protein